MESPPLNHPAVHPVDIHVEPHLIGRNRLTVGFRLILAIPHLVLVGGPAAAIFSWGSDSGANWGASGGVIGVVAAICALIAWFAIVFTGEYPEGLYRFGVGVFRWSTRVEAYTLLLRDEYPPFSLD